MFNIHLMFKSVFCSAFVKFINEYFDKNLNYFFIRDNIDHDCSLPTDDNVVFISSNDIIYSRDFIEILGKAKKIFLHGMFHDDYVSTLLNNDKLAEKTTWLVWGGDLTDMEATGERAILARKFTTIGTSEFDYEIAKEKYKVTGQRKDFLYPSNFDSKEMEKSLTRKKQSNTLNILIGHSASASLRHEYIFKMLKHNYPTENFKIYSPLSYGERDYAEHIKCIGYKYFGENFVPLMKFIDPKLYNAFLSKINIAIFGQTRSQGLNTAFALAYFKAKIYCKFDTTHRKQLNSLGITVHDIDEIENTPYENFIMNEEIEQNNSSASALINNVPQKQIWKKLLFS